MRAFRREGDTLVAEVEPGEREVLATVVADVAELLGGGRLEDRARAAGRAATPDDGSTLAMRLRLDPLPAPDDPAVHRLLPDASRDDPDVAAEFRRLTEDDLRQQKIERLAELFDALTAGDPADEAAEPDAEPHQASRRRHRSRSRHAAAGTVRVPRDRGPALAATLTDVRLVLGERLGVTDEHASDDLEREVVRGRAADDSAAQARQYLGSVFLALGWWQETLMACLLADLPDRPAPGPGLGSGS
ncbi:DUF2017 family protein [Cellulomonas sp. Marseille-Q8402]